MVSTAVGLRLVSEFLSMEISNTQTSLYPLASNENGYRLLPNP